MIHIQYGILGIMNLYQCPNQLKILLYLVVHLCEILQYMDGKKILLLISVVTVLLACCYINFSRDKDNNSIDASFKPMVKIDDVIYGFSGELEKVDKLNFEKLGEIKYSYNTINVGLKEADENFSSNVYEKGLEVYKYSDSEIVVVGKNFVSILKELN